MNTKQIRIWLKNIFYVLHLICMVTSAIAYKYSSDKFLSIILLGMSILGLIWYWGYSLIEEFEINRGLIQ